MGEPFFQTCSASQPEVFPNLDCTQMKGKKEVAGRNDGLKGKRK